jgi:aryl-alcohol dehydrogenase-like predicted oxidoreductase/enamine deaminase RidA (YjgF/YER057c/UK114 family)
MPIPLSFSPTLTGRWQIADMEKGGHKLDPVATAKAMLPYVEAGLTAFDMADHYGSAEEIAGVFARLYPQHKTQRFTKWVPKPGPITAKDVRQAIETSLRRLQTERLELLQFHTWTYADPSWLDCLFWLQELKVEGLIAHLGLTNFDTAHLRIVLASGIEVVSNQVCFSLVDRRPAGAMSQLCIQHGIRLLAYGTLAGGFLSERWLDKPDPGLSGTWSQMKYRRFIEEAGGWMAFQGLLQMLKGVAQPLGVSVANVASRYILDQPAVGAVIIGARLGERSHIEETLRLNNLGLDQAAQSQIKAALQTLQPIPGDSGDEYRKPPFLTASGDLSHHLDSFPAPFAVRQLGERNVALSGTEWEAMGGFSRALRHGNRILVSGTTATHQGRVVGGSDPAAQAHFVIDKIEAALRSLGGRLQDVVRTRVYVRHLSDWEAVAQAHGARFGPILPTNTLVQAELVGEEYLVEMEAEAIC